MNRLLIKAIASPLLLWLSAWLFDGLAYGSINQMIMLGLILALAGALVEWAFLRPGMLWFNTVLDWPLYTFLIYGLTPLFNGAVATFLSSVSAGLLFTFAEYALHRYFINRRLQVLALSKEEHEQG